MTTPVGALARGLAAGVAGTAVMTGYQALVARIRSGDEDDDEAAEGSDGHPADPWEDAPAPAQVARRIIEGVFKKEVPAERIDLLTNVAHWAYGTIWGGLYGLVAGSVRTRPLRGGLAFGALVWGGSYASLVPMGIYSPPWEYPPEELAVDLSYHLAFGLGVAAAYRALEGS